MKIFNQLYWTKEMQHYRKMRRRHKKELVKLAKETREFDWGWLHQMVVMQIKHMHEYYSAGDNVWQIDESRNKIVEQLQQTLEIQAEIEKNDEDFSLNSLKNEEELYYRFYSSIGKNILWWWD